MVSGFVVWAVLATWELNPNRSGEYAIIVGPFLIALAIYFLFPGTKMFSHIEARGKSIDETKYQR
jgi:hypothetical protein